MKDFTINIYSLLLKEIKNQAYRFILFREFLDVSTNDKVMILRHDVDARKENSLAFARIQNEMGIVGTYYFRTVPESYNEKVIKEIASLGHEIGYHYETMDTSRGNVDKAYEAFCRNLEMFRKIVPVTTACMHGSPLSKFDNRELWSKYNYRDLGIIAEPYFDLDFNKTFYLTDTGRRWDGAKVSVRDKAMESNPCTNKDFLERSYHSTFDIIKDMEHGDFPNKVMMNFHPQRWTDNAMLWYKELFLQNSKNLIKGALLKMK
ncbi:MAG: hypothetical protein H0X62_00140 [Bacteroidetes bacterium]|nr:hypothetical protein [Bacteroidota bacterium]